jgi:hypothetical protein
MKRVLAIGALLALAACGSEPAPPPSVPPPAAHASAPPPAPVSRPAPATTAPSLAWQTALAGDTVTVELTDATSYYRVEKLELLGPGGIRLTAGLTRQVERNYGYSTDYPPGTFSVGVTGGSSSGVGLGVGTNVPLGIHDRDAPPRTVTRGKIALPDPAAYRADPKAWKIAAQLIDRNGENSFFEIPAPAP